MENRKDSYTTKVCVIYLREDHNLAMEFFPRKSALKVRVPPLHQETVRLGQQNEAPSLILGLVDRYCQALAAIYPTRYMLVSPASNARILTTICHEEKNNYIPPSPTTSQATHRHQWPYDDDPLWSWIATAKAIYVLVYPGGIWLVRLKPDQEFPEFLDKRTRAKVGRLARKLGKVKLPPQAGRALSAYLKGLEMAGPHMLWVESESYTQSPFIEFYKVVEAIVNYFSNKRKMKDKLADLCKTLCFNNARAARVQEGVDRLSESRHFGAAHDPSWVPRPRATLAEAIWTTQDLMKIFLTHLGLKV